MNKRQVMWVIIGIVILVLLIITKIAIFATVLALKTVAREGWNKSSFCEFADNFDDQNKCYFEFAVKFEDDSYCNKIQNSTTGLTTDFCKQAVNQIKN